jgi:hypothetical protein
MIEFEITNKDIGFSRSIIESEKVFGFPETIICLNKELEKKDPDVKYITKLI